MVETKITIAKATQEQIESMKGNLRQKDKDFAWEFSHRDIDLMFQEMFETSIYSWVASVDGVPYACFGIMSLSSLRVTGFTWMVATDLIDKHSISTARRSKLFIRSMKDKFDRLVGLVSCRDMVSIHWHKWLGFYLESPEPLGSEGELFCKAVLEV